jgi:hypothetical protein
MQNIEYMFEKLLYHEDNAYLIIREIPKHNTENLKGMTPGEYVKEWKEYVSADRVLQNQNNYLFVKKIDEPEYEMI